MEWSPHSHFPLHLLPIWTHKGEWSLGQKRPCPSNLISSDLNSLWTSPTEAERPQDTHSGASSYRSLTVTKNLCLFCPSSGYCRPRGVQCNAGAVHEDWRWFPDRLLSDRQGQLRARGPVPPADPQSQGQVSATGWALPDPADHPGGTAAHPTLRSACWVCWDKSLGGVCGPQCGE